MSGRAGVRGLNDALSLRFEGGSEDEGGSEVSGETLCPASAMSLLWSASGEMDSLAYCCFEFWVQGWRQEGWSSLPTSAPRPHLLSLNLLGFIVFSLFFPVLGVGPRVSLKQSWFCH